MSVKVMSDKRTQKKSEKVNEKFLINFVGDVKAEFKKVSWTNREDLKAYTKVVIGATFTIGMAVYFMDIAIQSCLTGLNFAIRMITG